MNARFVADIKADAHPFDLAATLRRALAMGIDPVRVLIALGLSSEDRGAAADAPDAAPRA